jgi:ParB-like chromosome segregation protein Spo0J
MEVVEVPLSKIKIRFRLRNPSDQKVDGLSSSIDQLGLLHPIHIDGEMYLLSGYHRYLSIQKLGWKTIPCVIKDKDHRFSELIELDENIQRNPLNHLEFCSHIVRREELMIDLGLTYKRGDNRHTLDETKLTTKDLAASIGLSERPYQLRKQLSNINPEVYDLLVDTEWADSLMDLVRLSRESDEVQLKICDQLITGKSRTWKVAFVEGKLSDYKLKTTPKVDFNIKERFGLPQSIMKFNRSKSDLQQVISLVNNDEDIRHLKTSTQFGTIPIRLHQMNPDQVVFTLDYYTKPDWVCADFFQGRGTTAITSLYLGRRFIGFDINKTSLEKTKQVIQNNLDVSDDRWNIYEGCGCEMKELESESEMIDAVFSSPPYYNKAESYTDDPRDLCNMSIDKFDQKIDLMFSNIKRLIKRSDYDKKIFHPITFCLGTSRSGRNGIQDMSFTFQQIAKNHGLTLWDQMFVELNNPHLVASLQRNYELKFVNKNYESQLTWVKF